MKRVYCSKRRSILSVIAIGGIALQSGAFADERTDAQKPSTDRATRITAAPSAIPHSVMDMKTAAGVRQVPVYQVTDDVPFVHMIARPGEPARVVTSEEISSSRSVASGGVPSAAVYRAEYSGFVAGALGGGVCGENMADEWTFGNGAGPAGTDGGELYLYQMQVGIGFNNIFTDCTADPCYDPTTDGPWTCTFGLYTPPCGAGLDGANLIAGTEATYTGVNNITRVQFSIDLTDSKVNVPGEVWSKFECDIDDYYLAIGGIPTTGVSIGNGDHYVDVDSDGCYDAWSCFDASPVFGCDAGPPFPHCDWMFGRAFLTGSVEVNMVPREARLKPGDITAALAPGQQVIGNEILLEKGGVNVWLDVFVGDWDPADSGTQLRAYQLQLNSAGYTSGLVGTLTPKLIPCQGADFTAANNACAAALGAGSQCDWGIPGGGPPAACDDSLAEPYGVANPCFCQPAFIDTFNRNYVFPQVGAYPLGGGIISLGSLSAAVDLSTPNFRWAAALQGPPFFNDPGSCPNGNLCTATGHCEDGGPCATGVYRPGGLFAGSIVVEATADAAGTFTLDFIPVQELGGSKLVRGDNLPIPLVGFNPGLITIQTGQCCDLSTQPFVCLSDTATRNECEALGGLFDPTKDCDDDCGCTDDSQCGDGDACTIDRCVASACQNNAVALTPPNDCCDSTTTTGSQADLNGTGAQTDNASSEDCAQEECCDAAGAPTGTNRGTACNPPADKGTLCDDGRLCTYDDECSGLSSVDDDACSPVGTEWEHNVDDATCNTADDCLATTGTAWDCVDGNCRCVECAPLTFDIHDGSASNPNCFSQGEKMLVDVVFGSAGTVINGGQFVVHYDPSCVRFNSIEPGGDPYVTELAEIVDQSAGRIFYAVGVDPFVGVGETGNGVLATISFTKMSGCTNCNFCFGGQNPQNTYLVDAAGQPKCVEGECSKEIHQLDRITTWVPPNDKVNVDCDANTADVTWDAPWAVSSCEFAGCDPFKDKCYEASMVCTGEHDSGLDMTDLAMGGGEHPIGTTTYCCTATSNICGAGDEKCWTIEVNDQTSLDVTVQLSPIISGDLQRCITFELWSDCVQGPYEFTKDLYFGGLFDHVGHYTDFVKIPDAGQWACITARDQLHTLRACDYLECGPDGVYTAVFKGDPFFGGNWLVGGNLDAWKKKLEGTNPSINVIDILDFGQFVANFGSCYADGVQVDCGVCIPTGNACAEQNDCGPDDTCAVNPAINGDTPCGSNGPHADVNGDGAVDALDFSFVTRNFMSSSKQCCCGPTTAATGRTEISVSELRALGMADLAVADLNGDGLVNVDDMAAFMAGQGPGHKAPARDRKGSSSLRR